MKYNFSSTSKKCLTGPGFNPRKLSIRNKNPIACKAIHCKSHLGLLVIKEKATEHEYLHNYFDIIPNVD